MYKVWTPIPPAPHPLFLSRKTHFEILELFWLKGRQAKPQPTQPPQVILQNPSPWRI